MRSLPTVLLLLAFLATVLFYYGLARRAWGGNSDAATLVLQAQSIAQGHVTLSGWEFLLDPFWTVDVPFYVVGYAIVGVDPGLMFWIPAIVAALVMVVGIRLVTAAQQRLAAWVSALTLIALIGLPTGAWLFFFLSIYGHNTTILFCLVAFVALGRARFGWRWMLAVVLLALGLVGDLQTLVIGVGPLAGAGVVAMLRTRSVRGGVHNLAAAAAAPVLAYLVRRVAVLVGTYEVGDTNPHASKAEIIANIRRLPRYLARAFGYDRNHHSDIFGLSLPLDAVRAIAVIGVVCAVAAGILAMVRGIILGTRSSEVAAGAGPRWRIDDVLLIGAAVDLLFFAYAALADDLSYMRYLVPFVVLGSIFTARHAGTVLGKIRHPRGPVTLQAAGGVVLVTFAAASLSGLRAEPAPLGYGSLASFLAAHGLHRGVGDFWHANQTTVASGDAVVVRPVQGTGGRIVPRQQLAEDLWYRGDFQFLLCPAAGEFEGVSCDAAVSTFGAPLYRYQVLDEIVLVWSHPIRVTF